MGILLVVFFTTFTMELCGFLNYNVLILSQPSKALSNCVFRKCCLDQAFYIYYSFTHSYYKYSQTTQPNRQMCWMDGWMDGLVEKAAR